MTMWTDGVVELAKEMMEPGTTYQRRKVIIDKYMAQWPPYDRFRAAQQMRDQALELVVETILEEEEVA